MDRSVLQRFGQNLMTGVTWLARKPHVRGRHAMSYRETRLTLSAVLAVGALLVLILFLDFRARVGGWIWAIDGTAIRGARLLPEWVVFGFSVLTDFGKSGWFLFPLAIALIALAAAGAVMVLPRMSRLVLAAIAIRLEFLFAAIALPGLFTNVVKRLLGRGRPFVGGDVDIYSPINWQAAYQSFPSGHTTTAFSALVAFGILFPKWRPYLWFYAVIIAISRLVVTAHHPTDIVAGAVVGTLGAFLVSSYFAMRRRGFVVGHSGTIRPMPGPSLRRIKTVARSIREP
jgi:undecaprenyl-diphosphatase